MNIFKNAANRIVARKQAYGHNIFKGIFDTIYNTFGFINTGLAIYNEGITSVDDKLINKAGELFDEWGNKIANNVKDVKTIDISADDIK